MLGEIESNMKKTFRIKCFKLVLGVSLCFLIYLLVSLIIPPLIGTHEKSDTQAEVSITTSERVCLIDNNEDALLWRLRLIRSAQEEIILSTFDFRADSSGTDVIAALWGAAERGVQVRLIIDGINAQPRVYVIDKELVIRSVFTDNPLASYEDLAEAITASL